MAATFNAQQSPHLRFPTLNHQPIHRHPFSSLKFLFTPNISILKSNHPKPSALLKPFLKPSQFDPFITPTPQNPPHQKPNFLCASTVWGHSFSGGGWGPSGYSGRADFRVWSRRRAGSKKKSKRLIVTIECTKCLKNRYTTFKNRFIRDKAVKNDKKKLQGNKSESLELYKHCPYCNSHVLHKEVKK